MRKQKKTLLWPAYFDSSKTRREGRKISKSAAIQNPNLIEIQKAAVFLKLEPEIEADFMYPANPWKKTGRIWVNCKNTKAKTLTRIAKEISNIRQQTPK